jgi:hypothetical protein
MKKLLFTTCLFAAMSSAWSQSNEGFNKKDVFVSGSFGFESNTAKVGGISSSSSAFSFSPTIGYFITDNLAIGGGFSFSNEPFDFDGEQIDVTSISARLMSRYYFNPGKKFSPFGQVSVGFGTINPELATEGDINTFDLGFSPGINYFLNNHFSVEATIGRIGYSSLSTTGFSQSNIGLNLNLSTIGLGVNYKF